MNTLRRLAFLLVALFLLGSAAAQDRWAAREPWLKLVVPNEMLSLSLSPDGSKLIGLGHNGYGATVIVVDVLTLKAKDLVKPEFIKMAWVYTRSAQRVRWIADDLIAVDFNDEESESFDLNGKKVADLGERYIGPIPGEPAKSDWVLAFSNVKSGAIARVNARSGEKKRFDISPPGSVLHWAFDASGALRAVTMMDTAFWSDKTKVSNWYRADEAASWQLLQETSITQDIWKPLYVPGEPDTIVVASREGRDTMAVFRYDVRQRKVVELMAAHATEDIVQVSGLDQESFRRVTTAGLKRKTFWLDERWGALQATVDAALPGQSNVLSGDPRGRVLVFSSSDVDPGRWFLLDTVKMTLQQVAESNPLIAPELMRPMKTLSYPSFDGLRIPAYLTLPSEEKKPAPLVVLIHGGPQARDDWSWDREVQILAMNGYAVFQPQFRGSTGFGKAFEEAGYGQWGLSMQDDITAGVQHLIDQKIVDPERICIVGASYGGYAALWGLIKTPALYKCGVSFAGVTDIAYMLDDWSDRNSNAAVRELQRVRIGTPKEAAARFDAVSPLKHAAKVQVPVLLLHGERDKRVPISHGEKMVAALQDAGKQHDWVVFENAGHGLSYLADIKHYYTKLLGFLDHHIGPKAVATSPADTAKRP